jgi:two-component system chemotaxis sensor kinase CheA
VLSRAQSLNKPAARPLLRVTRGDVAARRKAADMSEADTEIIKDFLVESYENLDNLDREFVALETTPGARDRIAAIFRTIHTIKGTAGFLGLPKLEALAHAGESVLSKLRDGELTLAPEITSGLLAMVDGVRAILKCLESSGNEGTESFGEVAARLVRLQAGAVVAAAPAEPAATSPAAPPEPTATQPEEIDPPALADAQPAKAGAVSDTSIRVDVGLLDKLMNLVGELVLARNQILQFGTQSKDVSFMGTTQRLNLITTELQEGVMKTRMQPIGNLWNKLPRVVRDLALSCGKQVTLEMEGKETDLDRTIIEAIKDPLTHIVRNSIDHGLETPSARVAKGKNPTGRLGLRAFHEGGQVNIEISDDGAGIDIERVRKKATECGLVAPERARTMSDREVTNLIFQPGFSTAEKVTNVSGRGVGMDVVRTNIEKIGGTVDIHSRAGLGCLLKIKIPLTLAIIPALIVSSKGERFAIPQVSLLELVRLEADQAKVAVERIHGAQVHRLRGKLLPLVYLSDVLGLSGDESATDGSVNIVVVRADDREFGLVVDAVSDTEEIVVKPLGKELKWLTAFAGATIMGDGRVALILDVLGIAQRANVVSEIRDRGIGVEAAPVAANGADDKKALLLFRVGAGTRMGIPLAMVARLEEFARDRLEHAGAMNVIQYRGKILPLIDLCDVYRGHNETDADTALQVVVTGEGGRTVGLVVEQILDIVEETFSVEQRSGRAGILGAAIIQGKVTELVDVRSVLATSLSGMSDMPLTA